MTRGEINLIPPKLEARRKLYLNLGTHKETTQEYLHKNIYRKTEVCSNYVVRKCMENV